MIKLYIIILSLCLLWFILFYLLYYIIKLLYNKYKRNLYTNYILTHCNDNFWLCCISIKYYNRSYFIYLQTLYHCMSDLLYYIDQNNQHIQYTTIQQYTTHIYLLNYYFILYNSNNVIYLCSNNKNNNNMMISDEYTANNYWLYIIYKLSILSQQWLYNVQQYLLNYTNLQYDCINIIVQYIQLHPMLYNCSDEYNISCLFR